MFFISINSNLCIFEIKYYRNQIVSFVNGARITIISIMQNSSVPPSLMVCLYFNLLSNYEKAFCLLNDKRSSIFFQ